MGIDAVALLQIANCKVPPNPFGDEPTLNAVGDASLLSTFIRFGELPPDELGLWIRRELGDVLDQHADPRGILCFPDISEPKGKSYAAIVSEIANHGVWVPKVDLAHIPLRYSNAPDGSHESLLFRIMGVVGRDDAQGFDHAEGYYARSPQEEAERGSDERYVALRQKIIAVLGAAFFAQYESSVREEAVLAEAADARRMQEMQARTLQPAFEPINLAANLPEIEGRPDATDLERLIATLNPVPLTEEQLAVMRRAFGHEDDA